MDPSYTNGVGNQAPQNPTQPPAAPAMGGVGASGVGSGVLGGSSGAPRSSGGTLAGGMPAAQGFGTGLQQPIISSAGGDVVLDNGGGENKSRKGVIALIVLVALLVVAGIGYLAFQGISGGQASASLQEKYNSYVNYVLWGVESGEKPDYAEMGATAPYFKGLSGEELTTYVTAASAKYTELNDAYSVESGDDKVDLGPMKIYFEELASIQSLSEESVLRTYLNGGQDAATKMIDETPVDENASDVLISYIEADKAYLKTYLTMVVGADKIGCVRDGKLVDTCFIVSDDLNKKMQEEYDNAVEKESNIAVGALSAMDDLYAKLYGESEEQEAEEQ